MSKLRPSTAKPAERVAITSISEVQLAMDLKMEIDALKGEHPEVFLRLADLIDRYNTAVDDADKVVRAKGVSCGPFTNSGNAVKYNPDKMYDELGEELFLKAGGSVASVPVYTVNKETLEAAIQSGEIPEESVEHFRTVEKRYKKPTKLSI